MIPPEAAAEVVEDPREFLQRVMLGTLVPSTAQLSAAKSLLSAAIRGKKEQAAGRAKEAASGKFKPRAAPLKLVSGG